MKYDTKTGEETLKYVISHGVDNMYHIMKAVYFADKYHLSHYGRQINGNTFYALDMGPVPSEMYDFIKAIRSGFIPGFKFMDRFHIATDTEADLDYFSESDLEALDYGISEVHGLTVGQVMDKSHDAAYNASDYNAPITVESIVSQFENADQIIEYLHR